MAQGRGYQCEAAVAMNLRRRLNHGEASHHGCEAAHESVALGFWNVLEQFRLESLDDRVDTTEQVAAGGRQPSLQNPAVRWVNSTLDEASCFEFGDGGVHCLWCDERSSGELRRGESRSALEA